MRTLRNLTFFLIGISPAFWIGLASAAQRTQSPGEASGTCLYWAQGYARIAERRDGGMAAAELHAFVTQAAVAGKISKDEAAAWHAAIWYVYKYSALPPQKIGELIFKQCMADLTQRRI